MNEDGSYSEQAFIPPDQRQLRTLLTSDTIANNSR
jgi:hypothetical protein